MLGTVILSDVTLKVCVVNYSQCLPNQILAEKLSNFLSYSHFLSWLMSLSCGNPLDLD